jgi:hypothetical protein
MMDHEAKISRSYTVHHGPLSVLAQLGEPQNRPRWTMRTEDMVLAMVLAMWPVSAGRRLMILMTALILRRRPVSASTLGPCGVRYERQVRP